MPETHLHPFLDKGSPKGGAQCLGRGDPELQLLHKHVQSPGAGSQLSPRGKTPR